MNNQHNPTNQIFINQSTNVHYLKLKDKMPSQPQQLLQNDVAQGPQNIQYNYASNFNGLNGGPYNQNLFQGTLVVPYQFTSSSRCINWSNLMINILYFACNLAIIIMSQPPPSNQFFWGNMVIFGVMFCQIVLYFYFGIKISKQTFTPSDCKKVLQIAFWTTVSYFFLFAMIIAIAISVVVGLSYIQHIVYFLVLYIYSAIALAFMVARSITLCYGRRKYRKGMSGLKYQITSQLRNESYQ